MYNDGKSDELILKPPLTCCKCAGNASEICGGPYALSVAYNATLAAEQSASEGTFKAFGCYTDDYPTLRVLANASTTSASMTPQFCQSFCQINGYSIAGVEYSTEWYVAFEPSLTSADSLQLLRKCPTVRRQHLRNPGALIGLQHGVCRRQQSNVRWI